MGQSGRGRGRGAARPGEGRRGQIRGGEAAAKETGRRCFHLEGFAVGSGCRRARAARRRARGAPWLVAGGGGALLMGRSPGPSGRYTRLRLEIRGCLHEPWWLRSSFSFLWPQDSIFPCCAQKALE